MTIFNSYVKLPEGRSKPLLFFHGWIQTPALKNQLHDHIPPVQRLGFLPQHDVFPSGRWTQARFVSSWPIGSMVLVLMLTWLGYIDGIHVTIYGSTMDPMGDDHSVSMASWSASRVPHGLFDLWISSGPKAFAWCIHIKDVYQKCVDPPTVYITSLLSHVKP